MSMTEAPARRAIAAAKTAATKPAAKATKPAKKDAKPAAAPAAVEWDTEEGIAARFACSLHFIRKLRYSGKLRATAINGRLVRIKVEDARRFFEAHATGGDGKTRAVGRCGVWAAKRKQPIN